MPHQSNRVRRTRPGSLDLFSCVAVWLLLTDVRHGAALMGQQTCPVTTDAITMSAWCTARFGGSGGILTASAWDKYRTSFSCICNGNADAKLTITRAASLQQRASAGTHTSSSPRTTTAALAPADTMSPSLGRPPSIAGSRTSSLASSFEEGGEDSNILFSSGYDSEPSASTAASSSKHLSSSSWSPNVTGLCSWAGVFTDYPDGVQCLATTGICPVSCAIMPPNLCNNAHTNSETCSSSSAYMVSYTCLTCNGRNFTISSTGANSCTRYYSQSDTCNAQSACNGHGCCVGTTTDSGSTSTTCTCFSDSTNGYYTGTSCNTCQAGYTVNSANLCVVSNRVQYILASIAKTWTMVAPNMAVLFLFVIFGVTRKLNASDRPFDLTGLRRANLSTVQVARRRQQSLFHSKYIPMRPAKSRSFANPHQPQTRGPPAF